MALARKRSKYVTHEEFEPVKKRTDLHRLTNQVADIAEDLAEFRSEFSSFRTEIREFRTEIMQTIADNHAAILSAVMKPPTRQRLSL